MTPPEKFLITWNEFLENVTTSFGMLREDQDFLDITLVSEDGQNIHAHKVVLSSSSPFFLNLLKTNHHPHPLIYMKGVAAKELLAILDFIYLGQANIFQEDINNFMAVAEELQVKGLAQNFSSEITNNIDKDVYQLTKEVEQKVFTNNEIKNMSEYVLTESVQVDDKEENTLTTIENTVIQSEDEHKRPKRLNSKIASYNEMELDQTIDSMMERMNGFWRCIQCGKTSVHKSQIGSHIESHHLQGVTHNCKQCDYTCRTKHTLVVHISRNHKKQ